MRFVLLVLVLVMSASELRAAEVWDFAHDYKEQCSAGNMSVRKVEIRSA